MSRDLQSTIQKEVSFSGIGLHTGNKVTMTLCPAPTDFGVVFQRVDLKDQLMIPALVQYVCDTSRSTALGVNDVSVQTVEHVLAALSACRIDNLLIKVTSGELPIADGSSLPFIKLIEESGIKQLEKKKKIFSVSNPIFYEDDKCSLIVLPSSRFQISYTLHYPEIALIKSQYYTFFMEHNAFKKEIAAARTFALYEEIHQLQKQGLIKGGSLENALVIQDNVVLNKEGLRFSDEMVRHKILDLIGDLFLVGEEIRGHVIAICSGHRSNVALGKKMINSLEGNGKRGT